MRFSWIRRTLGNESLPFAKVSEHYDLIERWSSNSTEFAKTPSVFAYPYDLIEGVVDPLAS
jgi:hypothetical protein